MPSLDILLATYMPDKVFLKKLLQSLNMQTYKNINLLIRDDSENYLEYQAIGRLVEEEIRNFPYKMDRNEKNLGSNRTFERLTRDSRAEYLAYCDQDDIWEPDKIEKLIREMEKGKHLLCYSDLSVIDKDDEVIAASFRDLQKRVQHLKGENLFEYLLRRNSVTGCTMIIKADLAKEAMPFCQEFYVHDHWLALYASSKGSLGYVPEKLVGYRIHDANQIGLSILKDIENKEDYYRKKLLFEKEKFAYLLENVDFAETEKEALKRTLKWTEERIFFFNNRNLSSTISMLGKIKDDYQLILFELALNFFPEKLNKIMIKKIKRS